MSTVYSPILESDIDSRDAVELAIVDGEYFADYFNAARAESAQIRKATSEFSHATGGTFRLSLDGKSGYAVTDDGDLRYVFSLVKGRGDLLVTRAKHDGAQTLDCFTGYLSNFYVRHGFVAYRFEDNWTPGGPSVAFMRLEGR